MWKWSKLVKEYKKLNVKKKEKEKLFIFLYLKNSWNLKKGAGWKNFSSNLSFILKEHSLFFINLLSLSKYVWIFLNRNLKKFNFKIIKFNICALFKKCFQIKNLLNLNNKLAYK